MTRRVFLIVLDSFGIGQAPDAADFGDVGAHTLRSVSGSPRFSIPTLTALGLADIEGSTLSGTAGNHTAAIARLQEQSRGKDTTTGHWELAGLASETPFPTYSEGFPSEILQRFSEETGHGILCNKPYSGTQVIADYGEQHLHSGDLIVYTSADSVFQIAAHENRIPLSQLYDYCRIARRLLNGEHSVGRVIARPFTGEPGAFVRTANRRDFSLQPPHPTVLDAIKKQGLDVVGVGKIGDIFAGRGLTDTHLTHSNTEGMEKTASLAKQEFHGLCFVNLVDFDMVYGHRNDVDGYARALSEFDRWLCSFLPLLREDDVLIITADHGCDPAFPGTDHTREYVPLLVYGAAIPPRNLGTLPTFSAVAELIAGLLGVPYSETLSITRRLLL